MTAGICSSTPPVPPRATCPSAIEISDGRGQTSSAIVSLTLAGGDDHAPLQSDTPPEIDVEQGASYTANALGSFSDPDGDPLTLVSASPQNTDQVTVSTRADGQLVFNAGSMSSGRAGIEVTVSDGQQTGIGMIYFSVKPANTLGAVIDPWSNRPRPTPAPPSRSNRTCTARPSNRPN